MKKYSILLVLVCLTFGVYSFIEANAPKYFTILPANAKGTGSMVTPTLFTTWLPTGVSPAVDVFVKPANSLTFSGTSSVFPNTLNIHFYRWTEQMYLWLLSPVPSDGTYGSCSSLVLNSPEFYDVSPTDLNTGFRTLTKHRCGRGVILGPLDPFGRQTKSFDVTNSMTFDIKNTAKGARNLPVLFEKGTKKMFDVDVTPKSPNGNQLIFDAKKNKVEIGKIKVVKGKPVFYDLKGKVIVSPSLILGKGLDAATTVQQFTYKQVVIIGGPSTEAGVITIVIPDQGQSTGDVLMAKNGSLIYYNTMVNDVYAVFVTMVQNGTLPITAKFPTNATELAAITTYAAANNIPIIEPNTLAMEVKSSWIEITNLPNPADYVTLRATIPKYTLTSNFFWTRNGTKTTTLAMVGVHIVGSTAGHPEMIWGSMEHVNNTPNRAYSYTNTTSGITPVAADTNFGAGTPWLFSSATATVFNESHMFMGGTNGTDIEAITPFQISGSDTQRTKPFGFGTSFLSLSEAAGNAEVIATNTDVNARLVGTDIRKNYFHIGSTWNISATNFSHAGTNQLSNSTMETYSQFNNLNGDPRTNCFGCHLANNSAQLAPGQQVISHVFNCSPLIP